MKKIRIWPGGWQGRGSMPKSMTHSLRLHVRGHFMDMAIRRVIEDMRCSYYADECGIVVTVNQTQLTKLRLMQDDKFDIIDY